MKKPDSKQHTSGRQGPRRFSEGRDILSRSIPLEVDLENRQVFIQKEIKETFNFDFNSNNVDRLIETYIDQNDSGQVIQSLTEAKQGLEKPFKFNFIHPLTSKRFEFEYRYQIIYVKYASTRLQGELVNIRNPKNKK